MMFNKHLIALVFAVSLLVFNITSSFASDKTITWRVIDWSPFYILNGEYKGSGIYDGLINYISKRMPEYKHVTSELTTARVVMEINNQNNICHPSVITDSLDLFKDKDQVSTIVLSHLNSILLPHSIAYNKDSISPPLDKPFLIEKLLSNNSLSGGMTPKRYNKWLNKRLAPFEASPHIQKQSDYSNLVKMLFAGHVDYIIEYAPIINYWKAWKKNSQNIGLVSIENNDAPSQIHVAIGCTNNAWGRTIIKKINKILAEEINSTDFWERRLRWYDDQDRVKLRDLYQRYYFEDKTDFQNGKQVTN